MRFRIIYLTPEGVKGEYFNAEDWHDALEWFYREYAKYKILSVSDCANTKSDVTSKGRIKIIHNNIGDT